MKYFLSLFALLILPAMGPWKAACEGATACELGDRSYHVRAPDEWDEATPMPVMLHFHGWGRQGNLIVNHGRIAGHTRRRGVLLLAPNGNGRTWDFWQAGSQDVDFAAAVIEDAAKRYPIDRSRIYISGYSYGAAMAWRYACDNGDEVAALLAISGTLQQSEECAEGPRTIRHVHGLDDTVMGFPMGPGGDTTNPVALWRRQFDCGTGAKLPDWNAREFLTFQRTQWDNCADGHSVTLDIHSGGHFIPHGWIGWQLDQLMGRAPQYP
ncbi:polyhydroxybutyrate depolymerase [Sulfitobacter sp. SK012]|uniref:alpha/beta hydrolase family esterase n=1 Tax=Sulfitobacter sp. SK012 TaxID=1389005 RepID=UPI000E0C20C2|nr:PHB depolymerase family esterase [Sulfitobacter sp. SK012]AXI44964.1 polyhydroxybutyrate depolymerase [Sulfitobacter sp. SK012]